MLSENTELTEGGDIAIVHSTGWMTNKYIRFMPYGSESNSWLVSPAVSLGNDAAKKFQATLTLLSLELGTTDNFTMKVVVANDGENFSSANVIGTIEKSDLPVDGEQKDFTFDFTGFSGSIRLGYYIEDSCTEGYLSFLEFLKMGLAEGEGTPVGIQQNTTTVRNAGNIFNLQGQRMEKMQKGLYIIDGKKVIKK